MVPAVKDLCLRYIWDNKDIKYNDLTAWMMLQLEGHEMLEMGNQTNPIHIHAAHLITKSSNNRPQTAAVSNTQQFDRPPFTRNRSFNTDGDKKSLSEADIDEFVKRQRLPSAFFRMLRDIDPAIIELLQKSRSRPNSPANVGANPNPPSTPDDPHALLSPGLGK